VFWTVLSILIVAAVAPLVVRVAGRAAGWVLGLLPAALFAFFARRMPRVAEGHAVREEHTWVPGLDANLSFYLDGLSLLFALLITGIGTLIVVYAGGYMAREDHARFFPTLLFFMGAMLGLVLADNVFAFFVFFELTSLASYLLIGFYHGDRHARVSARKALIVTGGGGLALMAGLVLLGQATGTWAFSEMLGQGEVVTSSTLYPAILTLVALGAFTKSAQFPFHFWLPAAMAGPTPVSAYLHSATMVKAGVFLLARLSPVLGGTPAWTWTLALTGGFTMLLTAWLSLRYTDLKQILAYSTTMILGLLVMLLGLGGEHAVGAAMTFILVHALYKGALFMMAGAVDHETGTREIGELGGLASDMPLTTAGGLAAALSMGGVPLLFGFIGKEVTYEAALHAGSAGWFVLVVAVLSNAALFAAALVVGVKPFFGKLRGALTREPHEAPVSMWLGPAVLGGLGLLFGLLPALTDEILLSPASTAVMQESQHLHLAIWHGVNVPLVASLVTFALGGVLYAAWEGVQPSRPMAWLDRSLADGPARVFERALYGAGRLAAGTTRLLQSGRMRRYLLAVFASAALIVGVYFLSQNTLSWPSGLAVIRFYDVTLVALIMAAAVIAGRATDRFVAILALSVSGFSVALVYLLFGAPDLSMTQFAIETLTIILLVLVLVSLPRLSFSASGGGKARDLLAAGSAGAVLTMVALAVLDRPFDRYLSNYLAENSYTEAQGHNIVNVILVDFRGLDTLGEITVLTMAGLGVYALMRLRAPADEETSSAEDGQADATAGRSEQTEARRS